MAKIGKLRVMGVAVLWAAAVALIASEWADAEVEWSVKQTIDLDAAPVDVAMSPDWQKMFVLTANGEILIYSSGSVSADKIRVDGNVDKISVGPQGNTLILSSSKDNRVRVLSIDYIQQINITGSPTKGAEDAPVVIAVFSDFE